MIGVDSLSIAVDVSPISCTDELAIRYQSDHACELNDGGVSGKKMIVAPNNSVTDK